MSNSQQSHPNHNNNNNMSEQQKQFQARLSKAMYKTTYHDIGTKTTKIPAQQRKGINGKFTDHLIYSGMVKNASLNTIAEKDRWVNGSKDWMEHLG